MINIEDFFKVEIKVGKVLAAERIEGSEKLLKLSIDLGPFSAEASEGGGRDIRQILSGIAKVVTPEDISGKLVPVVANLAPRMMMGMESQGMILCADDGAPVLLHPAHEVKPGSIVR